MRLFLLSLFAVTGPAAAGCADYTDGSMSSAPPAYEVCYGEACDIVLMEWQCANIHSTAAQWTGGWAMRCEADEEACTWTWQGRPIAPDRAKSITYDLYSVTPD